jgi:hypothetical protein
MLICLKKWLYFVNNVFGMDINTDKALGTNGAPSSQWADGCNNGVVYNKTNH